MDARQQTEWLLGKLVATRKSMGLTQADVAKAMGIGQPAVSELERGNTAPKFETMLRYADVLGCRVQLGLFVKEDDDADEGTD